MKRSHRYAGLDVVRAIAALSVVGLHILYQPQREPRTLLEGVAAQLGSGVAIFFVLSGYLLYRPFVRATLDRRPPPDRSRFLGNRGRRIIPAYWAALTVFTVLGLTYNAPGPGMLALCYAFLQTWIPGHALDGLAPAWTLGSEVIFYLSLPSMAAFLERRRGQNASAILRDLAIAVALLAFVHVLVGDVGARIRPAVGDIDYTIIGTMDMFLIGMGLAVVVADPALRVRASRLMPSWRVAWTTALALYLVVTLPASIYDVTQWSLVSRAWSMSIALLLIAPLVLAPEDAPAGRTARVFAFLGLVSYGIYIWHYPVVTYITRHVHLATPARLGVSAAAAIGLGTASYYLIERRFMNGRRSQQPPALGSAQAPTEPLLGDRPETIVSAS